MCKLQTPTDQADITLEHRNELFSYTQRLLCGAPLFWAHEKGVTWSGVALRIGLKSLSEPTRAGARRYSHWTFPATAIVLKLKGAGGEWKIQRFLGVSGIPTVQEEGQFLLMFETGLGDKLGGTDPFAQWGVMKSMPGPTTMPKGSTGKGLSAPTAPGTARHRQPGRVWGAVNDLYGS